MHPTASANKPKHTTVITVQAPSVHQNPSRGSRHENSRNMGRVGTTYQKAYHA